MLSQEKNTIFIFMVLNQNVMRTIKIFISKLGITLYLLASMVSQQAAAQIESIPAQSSKPAADINALLGYFEQTATDFQIALKGLSSEQLLFKPDTGSWSVSQCAEHIILTDKLLFDLAKTELSKPAQPEKASEIETTDEQVVQFMVNRSQKASAPKELTPLNKYSDNQTIIKDFLNERDLITKFIKEQNEKDLREHVSPFYTGMIDGYQNLLIISAHCARHLEQIKEIKNHPNYPKN